VSALAASPPAGPATPTPSGPAPASPSSPPPANPPPTPPAGIPVAGGGAARRTPAADPALRVVPPRRETPRVARVAHTVAALPIDGDGLAFEVAARGGRVTYHARAATGAARDGLGGYLGEATPQARVMPIHDPEDDPLAGLDPAATIACELRLAARGELPLGPLVEEQRYDDEEKDPALGVLTALSALPPHLSAVCQLLVFPAPAGWEESSGRLSTQGQRAEGKDTGGGSGAAALLLPLGMLLAFLIYSLWSSGAYIQCALLAIGVAGLAAGVLRLRDRLTGGRVVAPRLVDRKRSHPAFTARLRLAVAGGEPAERARALANLVSAHNAYGSAHGNSFRRIPTDPAALGAVTRRGRPLLAGPAMVLSAEEIAWLAPVRPPLEIHDVQGLERGGPWGLRPTDRALGQGPRIGVSNVGWAGRPVCLPAGARAFSIGVDGSTRSGKSTLMLRLADMYLKEATWRELAPGQDPSAAADRVAATQIMLLDAHSDLANAVTGILPPHLAPEAVVLRLGDPDHSVGINFLDAHAYRDADGVFRRKPEQVVNSLNLNMRAHWKETWGPRMADPFSYATYTLFDINRRRKPEEQYTLLDVNFLLQSVSVRKMMVDQLDNPELIYYWTVTYAKMDPRLRDEVTLPIRYKLNGFARSRILRAIYGQPVTTIPWRRVMDRGLPIIADTAQEVIGPEDADLFNALMVGAMIDLARERARGGPSIVLFADEWHKIRAQWDEIMTALGKYGGTVVGATQGLDQLELSNEGLRKTVLNNMKTHFVFEANEEEDADYLARLLGDPKLTSWDIKHLPARGCYLRTVDGARQLPVCSLDVLPPPPTNPAWADLVYESFSRPRYTRPSAAVHAARDAWVEEMIRVAEAEMRDNPKLQDGAEGIFEAGVRAKQRNASRRGKGGGGPKGAGAGGARGTGPSPSVGSTAADAVGVTRDGARRA